MMRNGTRKAAPASWQRQINLGNSLAKQATKTEKMEDKTVFLLTRIQYLGIFATRPFLFLYEDGGFIPASLDARFAALRKKYSVTHMQQTSIHLGTTYV
jgi:hypothetical protein